MADEQTKPPFNKWRGERPFAPTIPEGLDWESLLKKDGDALEVHYRRILETLVKKRDVGSYFQEISKQDSRPCQTQAFDRIDKRRNLNRYGY